MSVVARRLLLPLFILAFSQCLLAKDKIDGDWEGSLENGKMLMIFHIRTQGASTVDSPKQGIHGLQAYPSLDGKTVRVSMPGGAANFEGTLNGSTIVGTFTQPGYKAPLTLTRVKNR